MGTRSSYYFTRPNLYDTSHRFVFFLSNAAFGKIKYYESRLKAPGVGQPRWGQAPAPKAETKAGVQVLGSADEERKVFAPAAL